MSRNPRPATIVYENRIQSAAPTWHVAFRKSFSCSGTRPGRLPTTLAPRKPQRRRARPEGGAILEGFETQGFGKRRWQKLGEQDVDDEYHKLCGKKAGVSSDVVEGQT